MTRIVDPSRQCLHVRDWPATDQTLWDKAFSPRDLEDDGRSPAAAWRPGSIQTNREGYGRWINFLAGSGADLTTHPADRVTPGRVRSYLGELRQQQLSIRTRCNRISQLLSVMLAIAPDKDWSWLKRRFRHLDALALENRRQSPLPLLSGDILQPALKALNKLRKDVGKSDLCSAVTHRDWLMVAMATLVALRRRNFANLSIERHMRWVGNSWLIQIPAEESKTAKPITMPIPQLLHSHIRFYLEKVRPLLLCDRMSDRLWITIRHTPMTDHSFYIAMTNFTRKVFGKAINPHKFRHIGATSAVLGAPDKLEAARAFLAHGSSATTQDSYIIGNSLASCRSNAELIARLRRKLPGAKRADAVESVERLPVRPARGVQ
jgi:integrase/recombinase XerD